MGRSRLYTGLKDSVQNGFLSIAPYSKNELSELTILCLMKTWATAAAAVLFILLFNYMVEGKVSYISLALCGITVFIIQRELPEYILSSRYEAFQKEWLRYLSAVKSRYIYTKSVIEAVDSAASEFSPEIQKNAAEIMRILLSGHRRDRVRDYIKNKHKDRYLKLFLIQAHEASENGDITTYDGESLFGKNVDILRTEVMKGIYDRKRRRYMFSGYLFVAYFPVVMIPIVQRTGLALSEELDIFYLGTGNFIVVLAYLALFFVYSAVSDFKRDSVIDFGYRPGEKAYYEVRPDSLQGKGARLREKVNDKDTKALHRLDRILAEAGEKSGRFRVLLRCVLCMVLVFSLGVTFVLMQQRAERRALTEHIGNINDVAVMCNDTRKAHIERTMLYLINEHKDSDLTGRELETLLGESFDDIVPGCTPIVRENAVTEMALRIAVYRGLYLHWYQIFVLHVVALTVGMLPILRLLYKGYRRRDGITAEVKRLQTVIIMERGLSNIGTCELLENMEMFSDVFRDDIEDAINLYQAGAEDALKGLRDSGGRKSYEFKEIGEGFLMISDVCIYQAFSSVEADRKGLEIMTELSEEIMTTGKKNLMDVLSWTPGVIVMLGYLIVPFLRIALADLTEVFRMMEDIQAF